MTDDPAGEGGSPKRRRRWPWVLGALAVIVLVAVGGFLVWATSTPSPGPDAIEALSSDDTVFVVDDDGFTFEPADGADVGFILYPGGRVDPASYAPVARIVAESGYLVVIPELRLNLAVLDQDAADEVIDAHPEIERWVIGGHSLGGAMAAGYALDNPEEVAGVALWAAYPPDGIDLSRADSVVTSVYGTRDGLTTVADIEASRPRLPADTEFVAIEGGNHAQFGDYGEQDGDRPATITADAQWAAVAEATVRLLDELS